MCVGLSVNRPVRQTWHAFQNDISRYCTACTAVHPDGAHIPVRVCRARRKDRRPSVRRSAIPSRLRLRTPRYGRGACAMLVLGSSCAHRGRGAPRTAESEHCALESSNNSECLHAPQNVFCAPLRAPARLALLNASIARPQMLPRWRQTLPRWL